MKSLVDVIHTGFPKTGTTWLQDNLLAQNSGFLCIGKPYLTSPKFRGFLNRLATENDFLFSAQKYQMEFEEHFLEANKYDITSRVRIISYELLSGEIYSGKGAKEALDRIHAIFGNVKILITIREQGAIIESLYKHYLRAGGSLHIREFLYRKNSPAVDEFGNQNVFDKYSYDRYIQYCQKLFGRDKVKVVPFELLRESVGEFVGEVLSFCEVALENPAFLEMPSKNPSLSFLGLIVLRLINQHVATPHSDSWFIRPAYYFFRPLRSRFYEPIDRGIFSRLSSNRKFIDSRKYFPHERFAKWLLPKLRSSDDNYSIREDIVSRFRESNQKTALLTGIDLESLGYLV